MKRQGCVADGFLSGYGNEEKNVALINRLNCYYLHRAVQTWLKPPNWERVNKIRRDITRPKIVYGMFIAEAINTRAKYRDTLNDRRFKFKKMCKPGTDDYWGPRTCVPSLKKAEYRRYVLQIMKEAIDNDIQSFLFGQVEMQDARSYEKSRLPEILSEIRAYAAEKGRRIVIGAQTNTITDERYLQMFDYIEGGVGLNADGTIEDGPCYSRYLREKNWCWALLWHDRYRSKARNVFVHLDWNGDVSDDMGTFTAFPKSKRTRVLRDLHKFFTDRGIGFMLPVFTALPAEHKGCYGNRPRYYSADNSFKCRDEDTIREILTNI